MSVPGFTLIPVNARSYEMSPLGATPVTPRSIVTVIGGIACGTSAPPFVDIVTEPVTVTSKWIF